MNQQTIKAINAAGGLQPLAAKMGVSYQAVQKWRNSRIPATRVLDIERITGISRYEIRPDIFGPEPRVVGE